MVAEGYTPEVQKRIESLPFFILNDVRKRGFSDQEIAGMDDRTIFTEYCNWHGLINWGGELWDVGPKNSDGFAIEGEVAWIGFGGRVFDRNSDSGSSRGCRFLLPWIRGSDFLCGVSTCLEVWPGGWIQRITTHHCEYRTMPTKTFDTKCYDLAAAFLRDEPRWLALLAKQQLDEVNDLAGRIQATIENFLEELE